MFSLVMAGNHSVWDVPIGESRHDTFPLSRFLEYTDPSIVTSFEPITAETLSYLVGLPTLFMSEIYLDDHKNEVFRIRLGKVYQPSVVAGEIHYTFEISHDFGEVLVAAREDFRKAFRMDAFELHRTHWAIKSADLNTVLSKFLAHAPNLSGITASPSPPMPAQIPVDVVDTLQSFLANVLALEENPGEEIFYRGHSDYSYLLAPSLLRRNEAGGYKYLLKEEIMVRELLSVQDAQFANDRSMLDRLVRMQHFGLPTRLLDVSSNPLVALYFSCSSAKKDAEGNEIDGEVIILRSPSKEVLHSDSDRVSCISNLCLMKEEEKNAMDLTMDKAAFNKDPIIKKLLHFIKGEKPYFEGRIIPTDLQKILFVRARHTHERMISQSGAFLLFGKDAILPETGHSSIKVSRIRVRNKARILAQLAKLNIKASTIYPGIEKSASDIAKKYELA
ncbi:FRG domain-containing protein (plasmid) [Cereibacter azotoformans]|uniref:FRG domain-containing protein n=1 Tax=Cereibacter azotoformans TaxID=43057 RepID=UPI003B222889